MHESANPTPPPPNTKKHKHTHTLVCNKQKKYIVPTLPNTNAAGSIYNLLFNKYYFFQQKKKENPSLFILHLHIPTYIPYI